MQMVSKWNTDNVINTTIDMQVVFYLMLFFGVFQTILIFSVFQKQTLTQIIKTEQYRTQMLYFKMSETQIEPLIWSKL